jgi:peroxiredoxin Q/BCP
MPRAKPAKRKAKTKGKPKPAKRRVPKARVLAARAAKNVLRDANLIAAVEELQEGDEAPDVELTDQDDNVFRLSDLRGQHVVLYFYPKDMTSGCTTEACGFNDALPQFEGVEARIVGVSPDSAESHRKFIAKHGLRFTLAFDPTRKALEAFGVWKQKQLYGRTYMGVERSTFLIGPDGRLRGVWRKVSPDGHAQAVLESLRSSAKRAEG